MAGASRFPFSLHKSKKKQKHRYTCLSGFFFPRTTHAKMSTQMSQGLFVLLAFRRQNMISRSWICRLGMSCRLSRGIYWQRDETTVISWLYIYSIVLQTGLPLFRPMWASSVQCRHWSRHMAKASFIPHAWVTNTHSIWVTNTHSILYSIVRNFR